MLLSIYNNSELTRLQYIHFAVNAALVASVKLILLSASGLLMFSGAPDNPSLDITAKYEGTHTPTESAGTEDEKVVVTMNITGMRLRPDPIKFTVTRIDKNLKETEITDDVQNNAVSFLLTSSPGVPGKFREELSNEDRATIATKVGDVLIGSVSGLLSSAIAHLDFRWRVFSASRNSAPGYCSLKLSYSDLFPLFSCSARECAGTQRCLCCRLPWRALASP